MESEIWKPVPPILVGGATNYEVSNFGQIRDSETLMAVKTTSNLSKNSYGKYPILAYESEIYYLHRLVYGAFNPEIVDQILTGTVLFKKIDPDMVDNNQVFRVHLKDLLFNPSVIKAKLKAIDINLPPEKANHSIYGDFYYYKPMTVITHRTDKITKEHIVEKYYNYRLILTKNNEIPCKILNSVGKELSIFYKKGHDPIISLSKDKITLKYTLTHVLLTSIFPDIQPQFTVDHIDDDPLNHDITNLQWMTRSENAIKGQIKSCLTPRTGKTVLMICPATNECLETFISIEAAGRYIKATYGHIYKGETGTMSSKISRAISRPTIKAYKFYWEFEKDAPIADEIWKKIQFHEDYVYEISNKGRIKKTYGSITKGTPIRGRKYRMTDIIIGIDEQGKYILRKYYTHQLVWHTFNGALPDQESGLEILHDDNSPLDEAGCYRNWLADLRLGTRSENNQEKHEATKIELLNQSLL